MPHLMHLTLPSLQPPLWRFSDGINLPRFLEQYDDRPFRLTTPNGVWSALLRRLTANRGVQRKRPDYGDMIIVNAGVFDPLVIARTIALDSHINPYGFV